MVCWYTQPLVLSSADNLILEELNLSWNPLQTVGASAILQSVSVSFVLVGFSLYRSFCLRVLSWTFEHGCTDTCFVGVCCCCCCFCFGLVFWRVSYILNAYVGCCFLYLLSSAEHVSNEKVLDIKSSSSSLLFLKICLSVCLSVSVSVCLSVSVSLQRW